MARHKRTGRHLTAIEVASLRLPTGDAVGLAIDGAVMLLNPHEARHLGNWLLEAAEVAEQSEGGEDYARELRAGLASDG
jgi:hypothetical protein